MIYDKDVKCTFQVYYNSNIRITTECQLFSCVFYSLLLTSLTGIECIVIEIWAW